MEPIVVEVTRGDVVEARHVVHAVAVRDGRVELAAGDPGLVTYLRSSAKPLQALPLVPGATDLDDEEIAIACASHLAVARAARGRPQRCSPKAPRPRTTSSAAPSRRALEHNCSGKHAGMLALCRAQRLGERRLPARRRTRASTRCSPRSRPPPR